MASETRFEISCHDEAGNVETHICTIGTVYIDGDNGKKEPAPKLEFHNHCQCVEEGLDGTPDHCSRLCSGQKAWESMVIDLQLRDEAEASCAQFFVEFSGEAKHRLESSWWHLLGSEDEKKGKPAKKK